MSMHKAVFLDRDGTLIQNKHYLKDPNQIEIIDRTIPALHLLAAQGYKLIIITNQSGIGRGLISLEAYQAVEKRLNERFKRKSVHIDDTYYCPHHPTEAQGEYLLACECRKPKPGMLATALAAHNIDPKQSFMIGDAITDIQAGLAIGIPSIYLLQGRPLDASETECADFVAEDLFDAVVNHILT